MGDRPPLAYQPYNSKRLSQQSLGSSSPAGPSTPLSVGTPAAAENSSSSRPSPFIRPGHSRLGSTGFDFDKGLLPNGRPASIASLQSAHALSPGSSAALLHSTLSSTPPRHSPLVPSPEASTSHAPPLGNRSYHHPSLPPRNASNSSAFSAATTNASCSGVTSPARPSTPNRPAQAPFRPGFQAKGVYRDLTEVYMSARKGKGEIRRLDEGRLQKRLEKLIELHFPPPTLEARKRPNPAARSSISSFSSLTSLSSVAAPSPANPSTSFFSRLTSASTSAALREAEQAIVKWQDDTAARCCAVCGTSFGVRTRKHHCRLCGRVVCFLPPGVGPVVRWERCSTFVTYQRDGVSEKDGGELVELDEDEMGISPQSTSLVSVSQKPPTSQLPKRRGVRVCRECLAVVLRKQAMDRPARMPPYIRLHVVLAQLEGEVEALLEDFAEHIVEMHRLSDQSKNALAARKKLLSTLASYDATAKRIADLPLTGAPGGAQDRLQRAIGLRAAVFLQERMAMLRGLGAFELDGLVDGGGSGGKQKSSGVKTLAEVTSQPDAEGSEEGKAARLAVLLEQETLVKGYLEEAQSRRQFEDAASLNASLEELRAEIRALRV